MAQQKDGTTSKYYAGLDDTSNYPTAGEKVTTDVITRLINELDGLKRRLGITALDGVSPGNEPFWKGYGNLADRIATFGAGADHGGLLGLGDDDHTQYHNDARGDVRYYTKAQLDGGQLDTIYFQELEHINATTGAPDAGKPIVTNGDGLVDPSFLSSARQNHVIVKSTADLPAPSAGVITLADNTVYELNGPINIGTDRIETGVNNGIIGIDRFRDKFLYDGSNFCITATSKNFYAYNFGIIANSGGGDGKGIKFDTASGFAGIVIRVNFENIGETLCEADGCDNFFFLENYVDLVSGNGGSGVIFSGTLDLVDIRGNIFRGFPGNDTMIALGSSTVESLNISENSFILENLQTAIGGTPTITGRALYYANRFIPVGGTPVEMSLSTRAIFDETRIATRIDLPGVLSPTALIANVDNYAPTNIEAAQIIRMSTDGGNYTVSGIQAFTGVMFLLNHTGGRIRLLNESVSSLAANRFSINANCDLFPGHGATLFYDETSSRIRIVGVHK